MVLWTQKVLGKNYKKLKRSRVAGRGLLGSVGRKQAAVVNQMVREGLNEM